MTNNSLKRWRAIHTWSSLICTLFLLLLCLTGLPLIFHHELDDALGNNITAPVHPSGTPLASLDDLVISIKNHRPNDVIQYLIWEAGEKGQVTAVIAPQANTPPDDTESLIIDAHTALIIGKPDINNSLTFVLLKLHTDLFMGLYGKLFLGFMGFLFVIATVSGVLLYAPFMRKLEFGTIRHAKSKPIKWLDIHNLLGISTMAWVLVVGITGVIASLADLAVQQWRTDQLAAMTAPYNNQPPLTTLASLSAAGVQAHVIASDMTPSFIAFPNTTFSSKHHYTFFMRGQTPFTAFLWKPILMDASTSAFTDSRDLPWYLAAILLSKPLHFGDYGGMPLKILWAILNIFAIIILGSGIYLWLKRTLKQ